MKTKKRDASNANQSKVEVIIARVLSLIDHIDSNFRELKGLILELARRLDEEGICVRGHICREIKKILKDRISQGKVTEKWIEECLPVEYKRRYNKSELSSLSRQHRAAKEQSDQPLIQVDNTGEEVMEDKGGENASPSNETGETNNEGYTLLIENSELKIHGSELVFMIPREKYQEVNDAMEKSTDFIQIIFDQLGPFIRAGPDVKKR